MKDFETGKPIIDILNAKEMPDPEEVLKMLMDSFINQMNEEAKLMELITPHAAGLIAFEMCTFIHDKIGMLLLKQLAHKDKIHGSTDIEPKIVLANLQWTRKMIIDGGPYFINKATKSLIGEVFRKTIDQTGFPVIAGKPACDIDTVIILSEAWITMHEVSKTDKETLERIKNGDFAPSQEPNRKEVIICTFEHKKSEKEVQCVTLMYSVWTNELMIGPHDYSRFKIWDTRTFEDHTKNVF